MYGFARINTGDELSVRAKFVLITWVGPRVGPLKKAKVSTDKAFVKQIIQVGEKEMREREKKILKCKKRGQGSRRGGAGRRGGYIYSTNVSFEK